MIIEKVIFLSRGKSLQKKEIACEIERLKDFSKIYGIIWNLWDLFMIYNIFYCNYT